MNRKVLLMILDGWGIATRKDVSAIDKANTPFVSSLYSKYANSRLEASGLAVGLPEGQMGNSEVGHINIGAGRVVYKDLMRINKAIQDNDLAKNPTLLDALHHAKENNRAVHLIGLVSDGGVHSHIDHLRALIGIAHDNQVKDVFVHAFLDGRDTDPKAGIGYLKDLIEYMSSTSGRVASIIGRYYAMDRDKRWERVKLAYDLLVHGAGEKTSDPLGAVKRSYDGNVTDEFVKPVAVGGDDGVPAVIRGNEV